MTKLISYSLFRSNAKPFEVRSYVRGMYFNARMNTMIYPDWRTHLEIDEITYQQFQGLFDWMVANMNLSLSKTDKINIPLCEGMLMRLKPIFYPNISYVLSRDTDSVTTYREALCVQEWLESGKKCHAMHDARGHSGLMGGMVGFNTAWFKACMEVHSWEQMISGWDLSQRGSDQNWMNQKVYPKIKDELLIHSERNIPIPDIYAQPHIPQVSPSLWESNLTCRHIGSAGIVDMEMIRFFSRFEKEPSKYERIEEQFPSLFYWHLP